MDRPVIDALEWLRRRPWPRSAPTNGRTAALVVNYNTPRLIAEMLFSTLRVLRRDALHRIMVVDNSTEPESMELLAPLRDAGFVEVLTNRRLPYHGTGLNRGMAVLRRTADVQFVWVIDSDTMILRHDALTRARSFLEAEGAAVVGHLQGSVVHPSCMLFDPARVWRAHIPPFFEDGAPAVHMQLALRRFGIPVAEFPFYDDGYAVHLGAGTIQQIEARGDVTNRFHEWAAGGEAVVWLKQVEGSSYERFQQVFDSEVGDLTPGNLLAACSRPERITID